MKCPNCRKTATAKHFREHPECAQAAASVAAIYRASKRVTVTRAGGRPAIMRVCGCGFRGNSTEFRAHKCHTGGKAE